MTIKGHWEDGYYVPEPSVRAFEAFLAEAFGKRCCDGCKLPLGNEPRRMLDHKQYHPACAPASPGFSGT
jgi:hypothetical protein